MYGYLGDKCYFETLAFDTEAKELIFFHKQRQKIFTYSPKNGITSNGNNTVGEFTRQEIMNVKKEYNTFKSNN